MNVLTIVFKFLILWVCFNLFHELMHIKNQGLLKKGVIWVEPLGFKCSTDDVNNEDIYSLSGGIYTGIISFILLFITSDIELMFCFFTIGWVETVYGIYEWIADKYGISIDYRYGLYLFTGFICICFWWWLLL